MTDVVMPQMGESIVEGTLTRWLKKPGEKVERDEPLFEISTDKVDTEIPSPAAGTLSEVLVEEGKTVGINTIVARIDEGGKGEEVRSRRPRRRHDARRIHLIEGADGLEERSIAVRVRAVDLEIRGVPFEIGQRAGEQAAVGEVVPGRGMFLGPAHVDTALHRGSFLRPSRRQIR